MLAAKPNDERSQRRKALVTIAVGKQERLFRLSAPTFSEYASRHGYELVVGDGSESAGRPPSWGKVPMLKRLLAEYESVLWIDADAMILDSNVDIADEVSSDFFQALAATPGLGPNAGVWLLRRDERSTGFLDAVWNASLANDELGWWEGSSVLQVLGYRTIWPPTLEWPSPWMTGTKLLPDEWNRITTWADWRGARIHHVAGERFWLRLTQMEADRHLLAGNRARAGFFRLPWRMVRILRAWPLFGTAKRRVASLAKRAFS